MKELGVVLAIVLFITVAIWFEVHADESAVRILKDHGYVATRVERKGIWQGGLGPFYFQGKGHRIFRCETNKGIVWLRTGWPNKALFDDGREAW